MAGKLKQRRIVVELNLTANEFANGSNEKIIDGFATSVNIMKAGLPAKNTALVTIMNMKQDDIDRMTTTTHINLELKRNRITIKAGDVGENLSVIFKGEIFLAYGIYPSPDLGIHIEAMSGIFPATEPKEPFTSPNKESGVGLVQKFTGEMEGYTFINNGVEDKQLDDPVINGSSLEKIQHVAKQMDAQVICDDEQIILSPWLKGIGSAIDVSKKTGMIGYPSFNPFGIKFKHLWRPEFRQGGLVNIDSIVPKAKGQWKIIKLEHNLQCFGAGPAWETTMDCIYPQGK